MTKYLCLNFFSALIKTHLWRIKKKIYIKESFLCLRNLKFNSDNQENVISLYSTKFARFTSKPFYSLVITFNLIYFLRMFDFLSFLSLDKGNILFFYLFEFVVFYVRFHLMYVPLIFSIESQSIFFNELNYPSL